ncbi:putative phosphonate metabolism protein [Rhodobium orientis]|uniref:Phosphonate metabolism protein n=1 Tax=Rhodobium orientis TaxID=34017 RepID=A0A327JM03_9HYPH|nr:DUF1045 domain-containing protein [Rhodobium orientis]MBB4303606.1 putative phosphonate metabolism protein [Rhodobium orientis]MBK5951938.1 hypothetical protein [Rhodobium orientis]RAI26785.1 hypothetical protein CH339_12895 [Rhodobium orientis]
MRYAIYYTPDRDELLAGLGARWLGRDLFTGHTMQQALAGDIDPERLEIVTRDPRRYGFHATLKPPFRLKDGAEPAELAARFEAFAKTHAPVALSGLVVARIGGFLALVPAAPSQELEHLAAAAVEAFDDLRAPPSEEEIARRRPDALTGRQRDLLQRWGYPYVFEEFRFHMTLTGKLDDAVEAETLAAAARSFFAPVIEKPISLSTVALCIESAPATPFLAERLSPLQASTDVDA